MLKVLITSASRYPVNRSVIRKVVARVIDAAGLGNVDIEISVAVVGERKMNAILKKYMDDGLDHSVLSFGLEEIQSRDKGFVNAPSQGLALGDIILCWPKILREAARDDVMVDTKIEELTAHSTSHLLGKHHE